MERPRPRRLILVALTTLGICAAGLGAYALSRYEPVPLDGCPPERVPVLAVPAEGLEIATSCVPSPDLSYKGVDYTLGCEPVPASRVGRVLVADGGETEFLGARAVVGIPPGHALIIEGEGCNKGMLVALASDLTDEEYDGLRSPVGRGRG